MTCPKTPKCSTAAADAMENAGTVFAESYCCDDCVKAVIARLRAVADLFGFDLVPQAPETAVQREVDSLLTQAQGYINESQDYSNGHGTVDPDKFIVGIEHVLDAVRTLNRAQGVAAMAAIGGGR